MIQKTEDGQAWSRVFINALNEHYSLEAYPLRVGPYNDHINYDGKNGEEMVYFGEIDCNYRLNFSRYQKHFPGKKIKEVNEAKHPYYQELVKDYVDIYLCLNFKGIRKIDVNKYVLGRDAFIEILKGKINPRIDKN